MEQSSRPEKPSGKEEDVRDGPVAESESPSSRFKNLARRLINVPRDAALAKEDEWKDQKT